jgi:hypothetical protein
MAAEINRPSKAQLIEELHSLPASALLTTAETSVYLNVSRDLLRSWRWRECGPAYVGHGHLTRYRKGALDRYLDEGETPKAA